MTSSPILDKLYTSMRRAQLPSSPAQVMKWNALGAGWLALAAEIALSSLARPGRRISDNLFPPALFIQLQSAAAREIKRHGTISDCEELECVCLFVYRLPSASSLFLPPFASFPYFLLSSPPLFFAGLLNSGPAFFRNLVLNLYTFPF